MTRSERALLVLLLVASFGLRLWVAQVGTDPRHVYDERFTVRNLAWILHSAELEPENGFHPSLSFLPHLPPLVAAEAVFRFAGRPGFRVLESGPGNEIGRSGLADGLRFTPLGYRISRGVNCLIGTLSIWLCFLTGRRLFDARVGLLAAFLLAVVPWHLRQSAVLKPDIVVVTAVLLAFYWALGAANSERLRDWLLAGVGIGLALSAKFNAVPAAIPLTLVAGWRFREERRVALWLALAAGAAVATFLLLNPAVLLDFGLFEHDFGATLRDYARKGDRAGATWATAVAAAFRWLVGDTFHGPLIGGLALVGAAGLAVRWVRVDEARLERALLLGLPAGYALIYLLATRNPGGWHNWLVLTPFTSLWAAWAAMALLRGLATRVPAGAALRTALCCGLLVVAGAPFLLASYRMAVPETWVAARDRLREIVGHQPGRIVYQEVPVPVPLTFGAGRALKPGVFSVERLSGVDPARLDRADAELFDGASLDGPRAGFYKGRLELGPPSRVLRIPGGGLAGRGPEIWIVAHPLPAAGAEVGITLERRRRAGRFFVAQLERRPRRPRRLLSFGFWLPAPPAGDAEPRLELDGTAIAVVAAREGRGALYYLSDRIEAPSRKARLRLAPEVVVEGDELTIDLFSWRPAPGAP